MTIIELPEAIASLASLVDRVEAGEEIVIARDGRAVARLSPTSEPVPDPEPPSRRGLEGLFRDDPWLTSIDLDAPLNEEVARAFGMLDE